MASIEVNGNKINAEIGDSLLNVLRDNNIFIDAPCGGMAHCGKCKVKVAGNVSAVSTEEQALLTAYEISMGVRLACICTCMGDLTIEIVKPLKTNKVTSFSSKNFSLDNSYKAGEIGIAVDIGTTTVAVYFYELTTGKLLTVKSDINMQRQYGADVISRISACDEDETVLQKMGEIITTQMNDFIAEFGKKITAAVIVANTTMLHLLARLNPTGIARAPFVGESLFGVVYNGAQLGLQVEGDVYVAPCVSAYVGSDITAGLVGASLDTSRDKVFYIDIGTNGEMALTCNGLIYCCSVAAGPAFEGAKIKFGTGSVDGAINRVWHENGVKYTTINDKPPIGICGSGLLDAIAVMVESGAIDETGRLLDDDEVTENMAPFIHKEGFVICENIHITKQDVREVQLAKAAIAAGIATLLEYSGLQHFDIDKVVIAGGFGANINPKSAMKIGLLPKAFDGKFEIIGNGAGQGAAAILLSEAMKERTDNIIKKCHYIELSGDNFFSNSYIDNMYFEEAIV